MKKILLVLSLSTFVLAITPSCKKVLINKSSNSTEAKLSDDYIKNHVFKITTWISAENGDIRIWNLISGDKKITINAVPADVFWKYTEGDVVPSALLIELYN